MRQTAWGERFINAQRAALTRSSGEGKIRPEAFWGNLDDANAVFWNANVCFSILERVLGAEQS